MPRTYIFEGKTVKKSRYYELRAQQRKKDAAKCAEDLQAEGRVAAAADRIACYLTNWDQNLGVCMDSLRQPLSDGNAGQYMENEGGNNSPFMNDATASPPSLDNLSSPSEEHNISFPFDVSIHLPSSSADATSPECTSSPCNVPIHLPSSDVSAVQVPSGSFGTATVSSLFSATAGAKRYLPAACTSANVQEKGTVDLHAEAKRKLRTIFVQCAASTKLQNNILKFIRETPAEILKSLPLNRLTLGHPSVAHDRYDLSPGELVYFGVSNLLCLRDFILFSRTATTIRLSVSVDGVPIFMDPHGVGTWPILGSVEQFPVFLIGFFTGKGKPDCPNAFMRPLVKEVRNLEQSGFSLPSDDMANADVSKDHCAVKMFSFRLHKLVCDAPALSYVTCIAGHGSGHACPKCKQPGENVVLEAYGLDKNGRKKRGVRFATATDEWEERSHDDFMLMLKYVLRNGYNTGTAATDCCPEYSNMRRQCGEDPEVDDDEIFAGIFDDEDDEEEGMRAEHEQLLENDNYMNFLKKHHYQQFREKKPRGNPYHVSILVTLRHFDIVKDVVVDYMHTYLGVVKTLLTKLTTQRGVKMSKTGVALACQRLILCSKYHPTEFQREPETLDVLSSWKATQSRSFCAYYAPLVLRDTISPNLFENFCMLVHALRILLCRVEHDAGRNYTLSERANAAEPILRHFVETAGTLYGAEIASIKVHQLPHIVQDYVRFGPLDCFSAFPYESFSGCMKKQVRAHRYPATQIINRVADMIETQTFRDTGDRSVDSLRQYYERPQVLMPYKKKQCASLGFFKCGKSAEEHASDARYYKRLRVKSFVLRADDDANSCCLVNGTTYFKVREIFKCGDSATAYLCGNVFDVMDSLYTFRIPDGKGGHTTHDSREVGMAVGVLSTESRFYEFGSISQKVCAVPLAEYDEDDESEPLVKYALSPFLH